jgi:sarcosine oxidase subunit beta
MPGVPVKKSFNYDALVVGAGLHGLSCALHLARAGLSVLALEKDHAGRHASGVNAGGVRRLGRHEAEIPLSLAAMEIWHRIEEEVGDACGFSECGQVKVAETESEAADLRHRVRRLRELGYDHEEWIEASELRHLVPGIAPHCAGAIVCRRDGAANPFRTVTAFRRAAVAAGAELKEGCEVTALTRVGSGWRIDTSAGAVNADHVVNCAGAWGNRIARQLDEPVPLCAEAPMLMITERLSPFLTPVLGAAGRVLSFKQFDNGTLLIGGGHRGRAEPDGNRTHLDFDGLRTSARTVGTLFPNLRDVRVVRCWAGIEGVMSDGLPVIGPSSRAEGVYHAFGFSAHGFQLGPISGRIIADLILRGASRLPVEPFRIQRFSPVAGSAVGEAPRVAEA